MYDFNIIKYPRTPHLEGSQLQPGDEDLSQCPFSQIKGKPIVVEEKCDGANSAVSFNEKGELLLQSRGHYLMGGYREKHFNLMKQWAQVHADAFYKVLKSQYIMYGEWMYAKHSVFYDALPGYFLEFDVLDRETGYCLDTPSRQALLANLPVCSVPVLASGAFFKQEDLLGLLGNSHYIQPGHRERLRAWCEENSQSADKVLSETDPSITMEGLYIKVEEEGRVKERMKYVRPTFLQCVVQSGSHWLERPIIPNQLAGPIDTLFVPELPEEAKHG